MKKLYFLFVAVLFMITTLESQAQLTGCWEQETAWATCGGGYNTGSNWQLYLVATDPSLYLLNGSLPLIAGQNSIMGRVDTYQEYIGGPVTLTFFINEGWKMDINQGENVKIDTFDEMVIKLIPGKFEYKYSETENYFVISGIPTAKYYAIHLDVLRPVDCH